MRGSFIFVGCILIGVALGLATGHMRFWSVLGLGVGFIVWGIVDRGNRHRDRE